jgi:glycerol-3-phosphate dehydrogenase
VIGGGCTGSGVALDAATRGLNTAMIERYDFGSETSARSTKLIWAGIRYIATAFSSLLRWRNMTRPIDAISDFMGEFNMVLGAHQERKILLENNPHLTNWVPIAVPITSWVTWPPPFGHPIFATAPFTLPPLFKFYDSLSGFSCPPSHIMGKKRAMRKFPQLSNNAKYFQVFYEGQHNDARTNTYIALTAAQEGACVCNHTEMIELLTDEDTGKAIGIKCRDNLTGQEFDVYSKAIIFCGGPFTDELRKMEDPNSKPAVAAAAGTHIVLPSYYCPGGIGMLDINTSDGRFLFFLPWYVLERCVFNSGMLYANILNSGTLQAGLDVSRYH